MSEESWKLFTASFATLDLVWLYQQEYLHFDSNI